MVERRAAKDAKPSGSPVAVEGEGEGEGDAEGRADRAGEALDESVAADDG
jgi:hypothetical protein